MKRKFINKCIWAMAAAIILICGCGEGKTENNGSVDTMNTAEDIPAQIKEEIPAEEKERKPEEISEDGRTEKDSGGAGEDSEMPESGENNDRKGNGKTEEDGMYSEDSIIWDDVTGEGIKTVYGTVRSIEKDGFMIEQAMTGTLKDGGGDIMVMGSSDNEEMSGMITVKYDDDIKIIVSITADGGITSTRREGSIEDVQESSSLGITGYWEGEIFHADEIIIFIS